MRSYYAHLETTSPSIHAGVAPRPAFRSSAIFPVMQASGISSRLLFMGYWILKRDIQEIAAVVTLRDVSGIALGRSNFYIREAKTFRIELADHLESCRIPRNSNFIGSLEIEFFSTRNLFFPFPAVVINYYGPHFSSVVHTAQRVYNDFEDMQKNSQTEVPESGFNIYADEKREPFIGLINGSAPVSKSVMHLQFFNHKQEILDCKLDLGRLQPYETKFIYPARTYDLINYLDGRPGTAKIRFDVSWIFPRLLVGNLHHHIPAVTITHTYYDCSHADADSDYWKAIDPAWHAASLMVPMVIRENHFTNIYFYPIYSPSEFAIDIEIYNQHGKELTKIDQALKISSKNPQFHRLSLNALCKSKGISNDENGSARVIARTLDNSRLPSRIKLGLDIGLENFETPCNICTNLQPFNPAFENKHSSFRWAPLLADQKSASLWIMNSSPAVTHTKTAHIEMTFFRENDATTIKRNLTILPNAFVILHINEDKELHTFFEEKIGWVTTLTSNPYTTIYYFAESSSGVVGGDHGF